LPAFSRRLALDFRQGSLILLIIIGTKVRNTLARRFDSTTVHQQPQVTRMADLNGFTDVSRH